MSERQDGSVELSRGVMRGNSNDGSPLHVSDAQVVRAKKIFETLMNAVKAMGCKLHRERDAHPRGTFIVFDDAAKCQVRIREKTKMVPAKKPEGKDELWHPKVRHYPTGILVLGLNFNGWDWREWSDSAKQRVETQVGETIEAIRLMIEGHREWKRGEPERRREAERQRAIEHEAQQRRIEEQQRIEKLNQQMTAWHTARSVREFVDDVRATATRAGRKIEAGSELDQWLAWVIQYADRLDPLLSLRQP